MNYDELIALLKYRISNQIDPLLTEKEAISYLGSEVINDIDNIYKFIKEYDFEIFTHGTHLELAEKIIREGYHCYSERITKKEFVSKTNMTQINKRDFIKDEEENSIKTYSLSIPRKTDVNSRGYYFEYDLSQHFVRGEISYADILTRFIAKNNSMPCDTILIAILPNPESTDLSYFEDRYSVDLDEKGKIMECWHGEIIGKENFIGFVDIKNKKIVFNQKFDPKHLLKSNPRAMAFDMSHELEFVSNKKHR